MQTLSDHGSLERIQAHSRAILQSCSLSVLPTPSAIEHADTSLFQQLPMQGKGVERTADHLLNDIAPALNGSSLSPNYYGFVSGGVTPAARLAESVVSLYDQNPLMHLPDQTVASTVEDRALTLLMELLNLDPTAWLGNFTTGATASNVLGLALGRESVVNGAVRKRKANMEGVETVGSHGLLGACQAAGIDGIHVYTTMPHSSLQKAASIVGFGRCNVRDLGKDGGLAFDLEKLEDLLKSSQGKSASIVAVSCGEVNTGMFATYGLDQFRALRSLCNEYNAWLHVDGAFGIFARALAGVPEFEHISQGAAGLELADSIAGDGHKLLNVPYDCGFFFCKHPGLAQHVFQNPNAAYLSTNDAAMNTIQSPLNTGIENSRRFRGLPVYATLIAYGRDGYRDMLTRQIRFARAVAGYLFDHPAFELLPKGTYPCRESIEREMFIIVLFRAREKGLNDTLVKKINATSRMYVSGTVWEGVPASRIAVSNGQVDPERDIKVVTEVLESVRRDWNEQS